LIHEGKDFLTVKWAWLTEVNIAVSLASAPQHRQQPASQDSQKSGVFQSRNGTNRRVEHLSAERLGTDSGESRLARSDKPTAHCLTSARPLS
jgi:hypothetical protein